MKRFLIALALVLASAGCLNLDDRLHRVAKQHRDHVLDLNRVTVAASSSTTQMDIVEGLKRDIEIEAGEMVRLTDPARRR